MWIVHINFELKRFIGHAASVRITDVLYFYLVYIKELFWQPLSFFRIDLINSRSLRDCALHSLLIGDHRPIPRVGWFR